MKYLLVFFSIIIVAISCKENTKAGESKQNTEQSTTQASVDKSTVSKNDVVGMYNQAAAIMKYRLENNPKTWAIIDVGVWKYDGIFKQGSLLKPEEVEGKWIDFDEKNKYEYGNKSKIEGSGTYHYDNDKSILLLLNNDQNIKPEEYNVRLINGMMIIEGKDTYKDNNTQAKLSKIDARPF
jgi:hypothetical protein